MSSKNNIDRDAPEEEVSTNSAPPTTKANSGAGISCINNCEPEYLASLKGAEGSAGIKLTIDRDGNVIGAALVDADSNNLVNRQALLAAQKMQFNDGCDSNASVQVNINFTVEGSQYDRDRREEQEKREQAERERKEQLTTNN